MGGHQQLRMNAAFRMQSSPCQARKKSTKINSLGPETAGWGGGLPREGVVVEKFVPSWASSKGLCKKKFVRIFRFLPCSFSLDLFENAKENLKTSRIFLRLHTFKNSVKQGFKAENAPPIPQKKRVRQSATLRCSRLLHIWFYYLQNSC